MIDSYHFGKIVIDGKTYRNDVILYPDQVEANWWRKEGHQLCVQDIQTAVESVLPEVVVVGTGKYGFMKVLPEIEKYLESKGIKLVAQATDEACQIYNQLFQSQKVLGAFHLTC